jgi:hypothetical protein
VSKWTISGLAADGFVIRPLDSDVQTEIVAVVSVQALAEDIVQQHNDWVAFNFG